MVDGSLTANAVALKAADGAAVTGETKVVLRAGDSSEILAFDLK